MIAEPSDLPARRVLAQVRGGWDESVTAIEHSPAGTAAHHWVVHDPEGPRWFVSADPVDSASERRRLVDAYASAAWLAGHLRFVLAPEPDRIGRVTLDMSPGYLLTVTSYLTATSRSDPSESDDDRAVIAGLLGELHSSPRPPALRPWQPLVGWRGEAARSSLISQVEAAEWGGGPFSSHARRLVADTSGAVLAALSRFDLLGAAVRGSPERWVVTHGHPQQENVLRGSRGTVLVNWECVALAPRERDLRGVVAMADGDEPMWAYVHSGGRPSPLSVDTLELFELEAHLGAVARYAARFAEPHDGGDDDSRLLGVLEAELSMLADVQAR